MRRAAVSVTVGEFTITFTKNRSSNRIYKRFPTDLKIDAHEQEATCVENISTLEHR